MAKYNKYDIATKLSLVEEYLELLKENPKLKMTDYAYEHNIADSTFSDWIIKYKKGKNRFINGNSIDDTVKLVSTIKPTFIEISKDKLIDKIEPSSSTVKLNYKDASLEFSVNELDKVMEILKRW